MRIDVIYGFPVVLDPSPSALQEHVLRYAHPDPGEDDLVFGGVVLSPLAQDSSAADVTAFDAINGLIDDTSLSIAAFDEWLANTPEGQALRNAGDGGAPAVLIVSIAPAV